jgi:hypothetical protein
MIRAMTAVAAILVLAGLSGCADDYYGYGYGSGYYNRYAGGYYGNGYYGNRYYGNRYRYGRYDRDRDYDRDDYYRR